MVRNFKRSSHSHRDVIFLAGRSRQIINARRMGQDLGFVQERDRSDMRDHETGLHAGILRKERRQSFAQIRIRQAIDPAFADAHQIGHGDRRIIKRKGERRAVKISARKDIAVIGKNERVIGRGAGLDRENLFAMIERAADRAMHLRHATQTVGVLDSRIVLRVRRADFAFTQERQGDGGRPLAVRDEGARGGCAHQTRPGVPLSASSVIAPATSATRERRFARKRARPPTACIA